MPPCRLQYFFAGPWHRRLWYAAFTLVGAIALAAWQLSPEILSTGIWHDPAFLIAYLLTLCIIEFFTLIAAAILFEVFGSMIAEWNGAPYSIGDAILLLSPPYRIRTARVTDIRGFARLRVMPENHGSPEGIVVRSWQICGPNNRKKSLLVLAARYLLATLFTITFMALFVGVLFLIPVPFHWIQTRFGDFALLFVCAVVLAVFAVTISRQNRKNRIALRLKNGQCLHCGYDLTGNLSGTCPECGTPISQLLANTPSSTLTPAPPPHSAAAGFSPHSSQITR